MDPEKHRHSFVSIRDESASGLSALRASTRSPSFRRLSLRQSKSSACSTTDSISIHSTDSHIPTLSCVTRDTPRDECAFHRFMVWVAVKRNECVRMTPTERLECPLLRCRKRFPNHEQMLRHLYACEELESGEYWCYDCQRAERFTDAKCKRCLGHPTKRRKILSMAKNFFTSLGHKSRKDGLLSPLPEDDSLVPPPSYDSLGLQLTNELCSTTEVYEIDSREVMPKPPPVPTRTRPPMAQPAPRPEPEPSLFLSSMMQQPTPPCVFPAELDTRISLAEPHDSAVASWLNDPMAYLASESSDRRQSISSNPSALDERRMKTRSKTLAPSSSLRSNASNSSTNTTNTLNTTFSADSTSSAETANTDTSPVWSEPWTVTSGIDADLDSNLLCASKFDGKDVNMDAYDGTFDSDVFMPDFIPELPADLPLLTPLPTTSDPLADPQDLLSFGNPTERGSDLAVPAFGNNGGLPDVADMTPSLSTEGVSLPEPQLPFPSFVEPSSLVASIWETLQAHVSSSEAKLLPMANNSLATQFARLDPRTIASHGHAALRAILQGRSPESPLHLLCYVHIVYAYFLVVHQEEAAAHSQKLFVQALNYANTFAIAPRGEYLEIAREVWEPDDACEPTSDDAVSGPVSDSFAMASSVRKGKAPVNGRNQSLRNGDALLAVAQYLLDEFEYSVLPGNKPRTLEVLSSDLWATHIMGASLVPSGSTYPTFAGAVSNAVYFISQQFSSTPGLSSALQVVDQRASKGHISTVRRAELELMQAAHGYIPLTTFINQYAPFVRQQCDIIYSSQATSMTWRCINYDQAIALIETMISTITPTHNTQKPPDMSDMDEFLHNLATPLISDSDDISPAYLTPGETLSPVVASYKGAFKETVPSGQSSPHSDRQDASDSTTPQNGPLDSETQPAPQKVEADACCELCGYRPKGHPRWFKGSMAKHKRHQHSAAPPRIYKCPYPGCTSQYKNRPDNLKQHQFDKDHFVDGEGASKRPSKRQKI